MFWNTMTCNGPFFMYHELEEKISKEFDKEKGVELVRDDISDAGFEMKEILSFLGSEGSGRALLDVGCGKGIFVAAMKEYGYRVSGVEVSNELLRIAKEKNPEAELKKASATDLPFPDNSFDCLICVEVLEHVPNTEAALKEFSRVLKRGGKVVIIDKNIYSLHPGYFVPTFAWKRFLEVTNRWMYPRAFPFKEKYFSPWGLRRKMKIYFTETSVVFLKTPVGAGKGVLREIVGMFRRAVATLLHVALPFLDFHVSWRAVR